MNLLGNNKQVYRVSCVQVKHIKTQRHEGLPVDEITVYELIEPIERPADVSDMAEYMDINMETVRT